MATPSAGSAGSKIEFAAALLAERQVAPRARIIAQSLAKMLPDCGIVVYIHESNGHAVWRSRATAGEIKLEFQEIPEDACTLGALQARREPLLFTAAELAREDYAHLNLARSFASLASFPVEVDGHLIAALEVISYTTPLSDEDVASIADRSELIAIGLGGALAYEKERNSDLESIARLSELYDLELVFNSTLVMDELTPLITSKIQQLTNTQAVHLWLIGDEDKLILITSSGEDATVAEGAEQKPGDGIAAVVADSGEALRIDSPDDERLVKRNGGIEQDAVRYLMAIPLVYAGNVVGVLEAVNRTDSRPFDDDDLFLFDTVATAASLALHNASLLNAERKVEILETLVKLSTEITSTLNLDRVLLAIVNGTQNIIPYERAAIALEHRGRLRIKAISGEQELNTAAPEFRALQEMLLWASLSQEEILVCQRGDVVDELRPETREKFTTYFAQSGMRCFYCRSLSDDQGRVGMFSLESSDPDFLQDVHLEVIKVLAGQATVALRNAELYREVPFIGILEPILQKKGEFLRMEKRRQVSMAALAAAVLVFLIAFPLPMRVDGNAVAAPQRSAQVQSEMEGVVKTVYVREGDPVVRGTILAELEDWDYRAALANARAKQGSARSEMNRALATGDGSEAGVKRMEAEFWDSEVGRAQQRLDRMRLRAAIDGVVATPRIENFVGRKLAAGESFAEIVNSRRATMDLSIDERDVGLLQPGMEATVLLDGYPMRRFRGQVVVVSPRVQVEAEHMVAYARVEVDNEEGLIRPGMQGRGKVSTGLRSAGFVFFRRPAIWAWEKLWTWFGW